MKRIVFASSLIALFTLQSAFAEAPVSVSGPSPAIGSSYAAGSSQLFTYTVTNNVPGRSFPITVSGLSGPVSRVTNFGFAVSHDCENTLPAGPSTCTISILIRPTASESGQSFNEVLSIDYQGRTAATGNIAFSVPSTSSTTSLLLYVTTSPTSNGAFGGITAADAICQADSQCPAGSTCKSMLSDDSTRTANPALNWVLQPSTQYVNTASQVIGTTTTGAIFNFPLTNAISTGQNAWTGLNSDWTSSTHNCTAWTNPSVTGTYGESAVTSDSSIDASTSSCTSSSIYLYCVQQP